MERDGGPYGLRIRYHAGRALSPVAVLYARSPSDCGQYPRGPLQLAIPRRSLGSGLFYLYHFQFVDIHLLILARMRMVVDDICGYVSRYDTDGRTKVASKILKAATQGERSSDCVPQLRRDSKPSTMWR